MSDLPGSRNSELADGTGWELCVCCILGLVVTLRCTWLVSSECVRTGLLMLPGETLLFPVPLTFPSVRSVGCCVLTALWLGDPA